MSDDSLNQWDAYAMQDCIKGLTKERDNWKEAYRSISNDLSLLQLENDELMAKLSELIEEDAYIAELEYKLEEALSVLTGSRETILQLVNSRYSEVEGTDEDWVGDIDGIIVKIEGKRL